VLQHVYADGAEADEDMEQEADEDLEAGTNEDFIVIRMDIGVDDYCFFFHNYLDMPCR